LRGFGSEVAKPLIEDHALTGEPILPDLDGHFLVKSVVECKLLDRVGVDDLEDGRREQELAWRRVEQSR
jgi:hypothetical protein